MSRPSPPPPNIPIRLRRKSPTKHTTATPPHPSVVSRPSSPTDMDIQSSDDDDCARISPSASHALHPPFAPSAAVVRTAEKAVHPPMLPADVACEMAARRAELQVAAVLEGACIPHPPFPPPPPPDL